LQQNGQHLGAFKSYFGFRLVNM